MEVNQGPGLLILARPDDDVMNDSDDDNDDHHLSGATRAGTLPQPPYPYP